MRLLVRYGEIGLKSSSVKATFEQRLMTRLEEKLTYRDIDGDVSESEGRIFADVDEDDAADAALALSRVPGVVSVSPVAVTSLEPAAICETAVDLLAERDVEAFAVDARRAGEHDYTSQDLEEAVGQAVVDELGLDVDLDTPEVTLSVEARYRNAYMYTETVDGVGGLPVSEEDRVAVLMTDRAATVAAFRLMKRGCTVFPVYTGEEPEALEQDMRALRQFDPGVKLTVADEQAEEALATAVALYDCQAAALPHTTDEIGEDVPAVDAELLFPNAGAAEDAVMETYQELLTPAVQPGL